MSRWLNWPIRSITRVKYHQLTWYNSLWLWRWPPHRLSKRLLLWTGLCSPGRSIKDNFKIRWTDLHEWMKLSSSHIVKVISVSQLLWSGDYCKLFKLHVSRKKAASLWMPFVVTCLCIYKIELFYGLQSGISLNLRTGPTGHATLFNLWEDALVFINKQIKTSPQW